MTGLVYSHRLILCNKLKTVRINVKSLLMRPLDVTWMKSEVECILQENDRHCCHGSHSGVRGGASQRGTVKGDGGIQSALTVSLPSAQTFINITSQPGEKPTSNMEGLVAPARK